MSQQQVHSIMEQLGASGPAQPQDEFRPDAALTPEEAFVKHHAEPIRSLPQFQQQTAGAFQRHATFINELLYQNALLQEQVSALMQHAELALPDVDRKEIDAVVHRGKSYTEAVRAVYSPKARKVVEVKKAAGRATPSTPRDVGNSPKPLPENASFFQIWKAAERELAARK
jgi:hypothetical protein